MTSQKDSRAKIPPGPSDTPLQPSRAGDGHDSGSRRQEASGATPAYVEAVHVVHAAKRLVRDRARGALFEQAGYNRLKAALGEYNRVIRLNARYGID